MSSSPPAASDLPILPPLDQYLTKVRPADRRVLSIQSHVVSGHVGNKCAVFPLELHGYEVDSINSVQFSNHTQYAHGARGQRLNEADLEQIFEGLRLNRLDQNYSHILTGYCGDATFLRKLAQIVRECRQHRRDLFYVCDPVLGDNGKYYVPRELCDIYRQEVLPLADLITPNAFELSELSGVQLNSEADCVRAIRHLHSAHANLRYIVCSGWQPSEPQTTTIHCYAAEKIGTAAVENEKSPGGTGQPQQLLRIYRFEIPLIRNAFVGSGDLFSALLLVWMDETGGNLCAAVRAAIASMQAVLTRTAAQSGQAQTTVPIEAAHSELQLVQSRWDLLRPRAEEIGYVKMLAE